MEDQNSSAESANHDRRYGIFLYFATRTHRWGVGEGDKGNPPAMKTVIDLLAMVAGVPRQVIEKLPQRKFREASEYVSGFTEDGPTTGEDQSPS